MNTNASTRLEDGVRYLRGGAMDRASHSFQTAAEAANDPAMRSEALRRQADTHRQCGRWEPALKLARDAADIAREHGLNGHAALAVNVEGTVHLQRGEFAEAIRLYRSALELGPAPRHMGMISQNIGTCHAMRRDFAESAAWYERSYLAFVEAGADRECVLALNNRGSVLMDQGELARATDMFRQAVKEARAATLRDTELEAIALLNLAESLARQKTALEKAHRLAMRAIGHFSAAENRPHQISGYRVLALIADATNEPDTRDAALERGLAIARELDAKAEIAYFEQCLHPSVAAAATVASTPSPV